MITIRKIWGVKIINKLNINIIVAQEIENVQDGFLLTICIVNVTKLLRKQNREVVYLGKEFYGKDASEEGNAETFCKILFVSFLPWLTNNVGNHDGKWKLYGAMA